MRSYEIFSEFWRENFHDFYRGMILELNLTCQTEFKVFIEKVIVGQI